MPHYRYTAKNLKGETINDEAEAFSKESLLQQLQTQGLFVVKLQEHVPAPPQRPQSHATSGSPQRFPHKRVRLSDLTTFSRQLVTMLESGVTLLRSLNVILSQIESRHLYDILTDVSAQVEQGSSLSEALGRHPKIFNQFWVSLVEVGETSGTLPKVLEKLSFYLEQQAAFRSTIISAIIYPAVLFGVCMTAISFFALFVGPRFETIFKTMNVQLPMITRILLASFRMIKSNFFTIIGLCILTIFLLRKYIQTRSGRKNFENFMFSLPTLGNIYRLIIVERFTSQMAILVDSGVPILQALDIASRLVNNNTCSHIIIAIKERVRQGELLATPMQESGFFPGMAIQMITVGEETGELSKMLKHVAQFYQNTVETFMKRLGTVIEPFMLVFMGGIIGIIVAAMFMPMFNLSQLGGGM